MACSIVPSVTGARSAVKRRCSVEVELSGAGLAVHLQRDCDLERGPGLHDLVRVQGHCADAVEIKHADGTSARRRRQQIRELASRSVMLRPLHTADVQRAWRSRAANRASRLKGRQRVVPASLLTRADDQRDLAGGAGEVGGDDVGGVPVEETRPRS